MLTGTARKAERRRRRRMASWATRTTRRTRRGGARRTRRPTGDRPTHISKKHLSKHRPRQARAPRVTPRTSARPRTHGNDRKTRVPPSFCLLLVFSAVGSRRPSRRSKRNSRVRIKPESHVSSLRSARQAVYLGVRVRGGPGRLLPVRGGRAREEVPGLRRDGLPCALRQLLRGGGRPARRRLVGHHRRRRRRHRGAGRVLVRFEGDAGHPCGPRREMRRVAVSRSVKLLVFIPTTYGTTTSRGEKPPKDFSLAYLY